MIPNPFGRPAIELVHRPLFPGTRPEGEKPGSGPGATEESIWISYCHLSGKGKVQRLDEFVGHHRLTRCVADWERLKIGGGAPPILCRHGWLMLDHGVHQISDTVAASADQRTGEGTGIRPARWCSPTSIRTRSFTARRSRCSFRMARTNSTERSTTWCFRPGSIVATTSACPIASISTTEWPTIGSVRPASTYPRCCRVTHRKAFRHGRARETRWIQARFRRTSDRSSTAVTSQPAAEA